MAARAKRTYPPYRKKQQHKTQKTKQQQTKQSNLYGQFSQYNLMAGIGQNFAVPTLVLHIVGRFRFAAQIGF
jgi:hypothetical protein